MEGTVEEGEIVDGWVEAEDHIVSIDGGVRLWSRLLHRFMGVWWNGIVLKVLIRIAERSFGLGRHGMREDGVAVAVARLLSASTCALIKRCNAYPP